MPGHSDKHTEPADRKALFQDFHHIGDTMSTAAKVINALALLVLLGGASLFVVAMGSLPRIEGINPVAGIQLRTTVTRDSMGIPSIRAQSRSDAYFALGWTHAQDRLWQMETQRRLGAGRLAEIVGEPGLASDRYMRTLGLYRSAERSLGALSEPARAALQSYADGVNAWMAQHSHRLPPEFDILGFKPEPWTPADSMVWQKIMAMTLAGNWHDDIVRAQLARKLDSKRLQELFPATPADTPVTLSESGAKALLDLASRAVVPTEASNEWVVGGARTRSGKPLLAGDPHLAFRAPILWYLAEVEMPGLKLAGATVPGVPFHLIAHNGHIAWTFTSTGADTVDLFVEKLAGDNGYRAPDGVRSFQTRTETIKVKGQPDQSITIRETRHGPVISDLLAADVAGKGEVVSLAATALGQGDTSLQALYLLNQATDWPGFTKAVRDLVAPVLNVAYADTAGNMGFATVGRVPLRKSGNGTSPMRGWTGEGDWTGWIPVAKMPLSYNPKSGLVINANNKVTGDKYPYLLTAAWPEGYRAARIRDLLGDRRGLNVEDMKVIQGDTVSLQALELKDLLTTAEFKSDRARTAARMVADWDGRADAERPEPLIYAAWANRLNRAILADELKESFPAFETLRPTLLMDILTRRRHWCDNVDTPEAESCEDLIASSLDDALADLDSAWGKDMTAWRWGAAHAARFDNALLDHVPLLRRLANLSAPSGGDDFTVSRGSYRVDGHGTLFPHYHGAGLRVIFDLSDLADSRFVIATGQSGNPLSRHYGDMLEAWQNNHYFRFNGSGGAHTVLVLEGGP